MVLSGSSFLYWLVSPCQLALVGTEKQDWEASRCPKPPSHASLSILQEELAQQLDALQTRTKQTLLSALPGVTVSSQQVGTGFLRPLQSLRPAGRTDI